MDAPTGMAATPPEAPLTESEQAALADEVLRWLASLPLPPGALFTRIVWLIMIGPGSGLRRPLSAVAYASTMAGLCHWRGSGWPG